MLLCGFSWRSNRNHYVLSPRLVMSALATSISMYVRVPTEIHKSNALLVLLSLPQSTMGMFIQYFYCLVWHKILF